jgi:tRNA-Thr(GGU) m(6)t(6)A37 methyltransferase TsaA
LLLEPIGYVRSSARRKDAAPRQPGTTRGTAARIELLPGRHFEHALADIGSWDTLWVLYWFHLNRGWRPKVLPPRSRGGRKGVFATRSPHRPNPLGLSAVRLDRVEGLTLHVAESDMLDGTPVLDLKPYVAYSDARPGASSGWLAAADPLPAWTVRHSPLASAQFAWLAAAGLPLAERVEAVLALGPEPHPYRRIRAEQGGFRLAVEDWRVRFAAANRAIEIQAVASGYRPAQLAPGGPDALALHRAYAARWGHGLTGT